MSLAGLCVVVTGGAGGLGRAMVRQFLAAGAHVVAADLDPVADQAGARSMALDVTDERSWVVLLDRVEAEFGPIDVLVNNAGFYQPNVAFEDMPLALWRRHLAINLDGTFLGCKHAILRMRGRGGAIVNIGSGMSLHPVPTASAYCASKAAVLMTTRTAAAAAGRHGIRVNVVLPGAVDTTMLRGNIVPGETPEAFLERMADHTALGTLASPDHIARGVLFLADPANATLTGAQLAIDGG